MGTNLTLKQLTSSVQEWNVLRNTLHSTDKVDLTNANLNNADLRDADLRGSDLANTQLIGACLTNAKLIGCRLGENLFYEEVDPIVDLKQLLLQKFNSDETAQKRSLAEWAQFLHPNNQVMDGKASVVGSVILFKSFGEIPDYSFTRKEVLEWLKARTS